MSPYDCDIWVSEQMQVINTDSKYFNYMFDKVIYWRLEDSMNVTIKRDREWFKESLPTFTKMWNNILYLRKNKDKLDILTRYIDSMEKKMNKDIMENIDRLCNPDNENYDKYLKDLVLKTEMNEKLKKEKEKQKQKEQESSFGMDYMFVD